MSYNKVLAQRNALLKIFFKRNYFSQEELSVWDDRLVDLGLKINAHRISFIENFIPVFKKLIEL